MIDAVATSVDCLPCDITRSVYSRGEQREYRFYLRERRPQLPVLASGQHQLMDWYGFIERNESHAGKEPCRIEAQFCLAGGVWYQVVDGIAALCWESRVWILVQQPSHYYQIMTRQRMMPVAMPFANMPQGW
jgi:hypothetical protein